MKSMTEGSPSKILLQFSLPMLLSVGFQQMYSIADSIIAGKYIGAKALAAVGASYPITMIFISIAVGCNIGCSVVISQLFGARQWKDLKTAVFTSLLTIVAISILLTGVGILATDSLIHLLQTPENIFRDSALYLRVYIAGLLFLFVYNICTGIFTALGDSKTPLYFLIVSSLANIGFAMFFVIYLHMGVKGVALATFVAQGLASIFVTVTLWFKLKKLKIENAPYFSLTLLKKITKIAVPSILQQSFISVGNLMIQGVINSFGASVIAGYSAAIKLNTFAINSFVTMGNALSAFTAQNVGAGKPDRVQKGLYAGVVLTYVTVIPFFIAYFFFGDVMMGLFVNAGNQEVIKEGTLFLKILSPFYFIISVKLLQDGLLRGVGAMLYFMIATFSDLIIRVLLVFVLSSTALKSMGVWMSWPFGWTFALMISAYFYFTGKWKRFCITK